MIIYPTQRNFDITSMFSLYLVWKVFDCNAIFSRGNVFLFKPFIGFSKNTR